MDTAGFNLSPFKYKHVRKEQVLEEAPRLLEKMETLKSPSKSPKMVHIAKMAEITHDNPLPLIKEGISLEPDMIFGWKPQVECTSPPIPLYFDFVGHSLYLYQFGYNKDILVY